MGMEDVRELRGRAARLLRLSLKAADNGQIVIADELVLLASEALSHAEVIERRLAWSAVEYDISADQTRH